MQSPCKKLCRIEDDVCIGCNRTLYEVAAWSRLTDEERLRIMGTLDNPNRIEEGHALQNPKRRKFT
jgi:predicted Fe-S protein YdhL (DUF1289 family)